MALKRLVELHMINLQRLHRIWPHFLSLLVVLRVRTPQADAPKSLQPLLKKLAAEVIQVIVIGYFNARKKIIN